MLDYPLSLRPVSYTHLDVYKRQGVLIGYWLHLGFAATLYLGRLANLLFFAFLAAWAVKRTPVAKPDVYKRQTICSAASPRRKRPPSTPPTRTSCMPSTRAVRWTMPPTGQS